MVGGKDNEWVILVTEELLSLPSELFRSDSISIRLA